ncbi:hypothetical protein J7E37_21910 [Bacillus sp. ISL-39]|nr:hypothetical protein [Bacillus sp. ISL-39]
MESGWDKMIAPNRKLSEVGSSSDRILLPQAKVVRSSIMFGQNPAASTESCPK